jgi:rhodanese-related sulfurtransferase
MKIIDVRETLEFMLGHVKGSINIPLSKLSSDFEKATKGLNKNDEIIVYCMSGHRAGMAAELFEKHGYKNVKNGVNRSRVERTYL